MNYLALGYSAVSIYLWIFNRLSAEYRWKTCRHLPTLHSKIKREDGAYKNERLAIKWVKRAKLFSNERTCDRIDINLFFCRTDKLLILFSCNIWICVHAWHIISCKGPWRHTQSLSKCIKCPTPWCAEQNTRCSHRENTRQKRGWMLQSLKCSKASLTGLQLMINYR